jgi:hypothetical protein
VRAQYFLPCVVFAVYPHWPAASFALGSILESAARFAIRFPFVVSLHCPHLPGRWNHSTQTTVAAMPLMYPTFAVIARGKRRFSASFLYQRVKHVISNGVRNLLFARSGSERIGYPGYGVRKRISLTIMF